MSWRQRKWEAHRKCHEHQRCDGCRKTLLIETCPLLTKLYKISPPACQSPFFPEEAFLLLYLQEKEQRFLYCFVLGSHFTSSSFFGVFISCSKYEQLHVSIKDDVSQNCKEKAIKQL